MVMLDYLFHDLTITSSPRTQSVRRIIRRSPGERLTGWIEINSTIVNIDIPFSRTTPNGSRITLNPNGSISTIYISEQPSTCVVAPSTYRKRKAHNSHSYPKPKRTKHTNPKIPLSL